MILESPQTALIGTGISYQFCRWLRGTDSIHRFARDYEEIRETCSETYLLIIHSGSNMPPLGVVMRPFCLREKDSGGFMAAKILISALQVL